MKFIWEMMTGSLTDYNVMACYTLKIRNLSVKVENKQVLNGINLDAAGGEIHAIMGPNGSGKSTLAQVLLAKDGYEISSKDAQIKLNGVDITKFDTSARAKLGLYLAMQNPISVPGVTIGNLLRTAYREIKENKQIKQKKTIQNPLLDGRYQVGEMTIEAFNRRLSQFAKFLKIDESLFGRGINDGFSGGEKKKTEMLQALMLEPKFAVFDEIDTGLDVDALKLVANAIIKLVKNGTGVIVITHYQRILKYLKPDFVHVLVNGKIVKSGQSDLARKIEKNGYSTYL